MAALICKVASARSPKFRYAAGREGLWGPLARVLMPQRLFDYLLRRGFDLPN